MKINIGKELKHLLTQGVSLEKIGNWAYYDIYLKMPKQPTDEIEKILRSIYLMDAGPEFEYTRDELMLIADLLIKDDPEVLKKVNAVKIKRYT